MGKKDKIHHSPADILAIDSRSRYLDNGLQLKDAKRLCIGSVHGTFSIQLINALSWCTVIKAAEVVPDKRP
jgi:hypothetical protein